MTRTNKWAEEMQWEVWWGWGAPRPLVGVEWPMGRSRGHHSNCWSHSGHIPGQQSMPWVHVGKNRMPPWCLKAARLSWVAQSGHLCPNPGIQQAAWLARLCLQAWSLQQSSTKITFSPLKAAFSNRAFLIEYLDPGHLL